MADEEGKTPKWNADDFYKTNEVDYLKKSFSFSLNVDPSPKGGSTGGCRNTNAEDISSPIS